MAVGSTLQSSKPIRFGGVQWAVLAVVCSFCFLWTGWQSSGRFGGLWIQMVTLLSKLDARSSDLNSSLVQWLMVGLSAAAIALTTGSAIWHGRTSRLGRAGSRNESRAFFAALLLLSLCLAVMNNLWPGLLLLGLVAVCLAWLLRQGSVPVSPWMSNICVWGLAIAVVTYSFSFRMDYFVRVLAVWSGAALFFQALRPAKQ